MLFVKYIPTFYKVRENHDDGNGRFLWTFGVYQPDMASCPGPQFDWSATAELCTLVVPHILSAACTTVTRLHGVTSQNSAVNQQTTWRSAADCKTDVLEGIATYISRLCIELLCSAAASQVQYLDTSWTPVSICMLNITSLFSTARRIYAILHANCASEHWMTAFYVSKCG